MSRTHPPRTSTVASSMRLFFRQFANPLMTMLVIAVVLSAILGESSDSIIILIMLLLTAMVSFWQEYHAGKAMEKLRALIETKHNILRDGQQLILTTEEIRKGDRILLDAGDMIPADGRILECNGLQVNESALTGESYPSEKSSVPGSGDTPPLKRIDLIWQGTNVVSGTALALVEATGGDTLFGEISRSLATTTETVYERGMRKFGLFLLRVTLWLSVFILLTNLYFQRPFFDSILFSLALAVGMAPELLPAVMTFSMSKGANRMMHQKVIVKQLSAIFGFGEVNVLCTDKTGTLTTGNARVHDILNFQGVSDEALRGLACLHATLQEGFNNPVDRAIADLGVRTERKWRKVGEIPYDFIRKRLTVAAGDDEQTILIMKGAFPNVLETCDRAGTGDDDACRLDEVLRADLCERFECFGKAGFRVLGLATRVLPVGPTGRIDETGMIFRGFILLTDPLKESAATSLQELRAMGVRVKIVTGDNRFAAEQVGVCLGMPDSGIVTGADIDRMSPEALRTKARESDIFAEIAPHQKERIVKSLQQGGMTVAFLGDGINDVAAIHAADIGISTNNATDVAKDAADFVLLDRDLSVLAAGIREGRKSFANSMKYIFISTGATFGNMLSISGAAIFLPFMPMLPKQILLNNLISDLPFLSIATDRIEERQWRVPARWDLGMIRRFMLVFGLHSSLFDILTFLVLSETFHLRDAGFQTAWFMESTATEIAILFVIRTPLPWWKSRPSVPLLLMGGVALALTLALPFTPFAGVVGLSTPEPPILLLLAGLILAYVITGDLLKVRFFRAYGLNSVHPG